MNTNRGPMPVAFFGIAVGALALANAWRVAVRIWPLPASIADGLTLAALAVWVVIVGAYAHKWLRHPDDARAELNHPVQSSFTALAPVSSMLAALALLNYSRFAALALFVVAVVSQLGLGVYLHGRFWQGGRAPELVTPAIYLPTVAPSFVAATASAAFGWTHLGMWFFGAGLLSWLAIESLILHRAAVHDPMPEALRPVIGIQLAPPFVGGVAYLSLTSGTPDMFAQILFGYGLFQALLLLRLLPWIRKQPFAPSYWAFSFGVAALPTVAMRFVERGATGPVEWLAPVLFVAANLVIGTLIVKTLTLLIRGTLLPAGVAQANVASKAAQTTQPVIAVTTSGKGKLAA
ncbi:dicarboxylate transporter/tellurite-resistance protein TehA [Paraburkholderia sp.]|uniref:dicarboxylate transporter/tellurite-resistance protein TehA n=1 Tax=Paraburkholderia sp. TaxID=1926495 RepID=UPI002384F493|nr:dicarboxylate transporter/tellurite-resistance protein TehA [Paraburkholderia sp.]MDE1180752.1 dicarboxylate transporter/tellurite-resistance protein TehA [Paraburkholderia sp.]